MTDHEPDVESGELPDVNDRGNEDGGDVSEFAVEVADSTALPTDRIEQLVGRFEELVVALDDESSGEPSKDFADELTDVFNQAAELLETVDLESLPDAIDFSKLPEAVETEKLPKAIENHDPKELIAYRNLLDLVELGELWNSVDLSEFWSNYQELARELADISDYTDSSDEDDGGVITNATSEASGIVGSVDSDPDAELLKSDTKQIAVQQRIDNAAEEFRKDLLAARAELKGIVEENRKRTGTVGQPSSRNPTAVSTMAPQREYETRGIAKYSTVPSKVKYSTAPKYRRIYGDRFEDAGDEDDEEST